MENWFFRTKILFCENMVFKNWDCDMIFYFIYVLTCDKNLQIFVQQPFLGHFFKKIDITFLLQWTNVFQCSTTETRFGQNRTKTHFHDFSTYTPCMVTQKLPMTLNHGQSLGSTYAVFASNTDWIQRGFCTWETKD